MLYEKNDDDNYYCPDIASRAAACTNMKILMCHATGVMMRINTTMLPSS